MRAKDYLGSYLSIAKSTTEAHLAGQLSVLVSEKVELTKHQEDHVSSCLRNSADRLYSIKDTSEQFVALDDFLTKLATFVNSCR